jgi:hypothetical protein
MNTYVNIDDINNMELLYDCVEELEQIINECYPYKSRAIYIVN